MTPESSLNDRVNAFNDKLKADGIYDDRDPWSLPTLYEGSILDIPETPESRERIEWLKQQIADLQRQKQERERGAVSEVTRRVTQEVQSVLPGEPALEEHPSATDRA